MQPHTPTLFSIAMPVLNGDAFVSEAIRSVLAQTYGEFELFIVDGGSEDETLEIVRRFAAQDERVKLIEAPDSGIYDAIFEAFRSAKGQVFSWIGSDDLYVPWALATVSEHMNRGDTQWLTGLPAIFDENGIMRCIYPHTPKPRWLIARGFCHFDGLGCIQAESTFFTAALFKGLSDKTVSTIATQKLAGDFILWREFASFKNLVQIPTVLGGFRIHSRNRSIVGQDDYMAEVRASRALRLPSRLAIFVRRALTYAFAHRMQRKSEVENGVLNGAIDRG